MKIKDLIEILADFEEDADIKFRVPLNPATLNPTVYITLDLYSIKDSFSDTIVTITIERIK